MVNCTGCVEMHEQEIVHCTAEHTFEVAAVEAYSSTHQAERKRQVPHSYFASHCIERQNILSSGESTQKFKTRFVVVNSIEVKKRGEGKETRGNKSAQLK